MASRAGLTAIGFDADDTLWQNERFYRLTQERFAELLAGHAEPDHLAERLLEVERRNLARYGFGIKGFTLSMIETAIEVSEGMVPASVIASILAAGRDMLSHPVETLPEARETLAKLAPSYRMILITKGDLFDAVEIVSDKTAATYERVFGQYADGAARAMMVGNSLRSDVIPAIAAGSWGVYIPHDLNWELEHADDPVDEPRYRRLDRLGELVDLITEVG
jgi:putative hydrolase of the HAD superfamily